MIAAAITVAVAAAVAVYHGPFGQDRELLGITRLPVQLAIEKDVDCCFGALCKRMTHSECIRTGGRVVQDCTECER